MINARRAGLCLALIFTAGSALAHDPHAKARTKPACETTYARVAEIGRQILSQDAQATYVEYTGDEAAKILTAINAVEPVSSWAADKIVAIDPDGEQPFRVALIEKGCATRAFPVPRAVWPDLVTSAIGSKS
jgi:hypothetical protein